MRRSAIIIALAVLAPLLGACAGTDALDPAPQAEGGVGGTQPTDPATAGQAGTGAATLQAGTPDGAAAAAAIPADARVYFAPVIGATAEAVPPLSARLSQRAGERGIAISQDSTAANLLIKGYFSAIVEGEQTTVIYVWDVLDQPGNRLHRIQGRMRTPAEGGEGWSAVSAPTMEAIADATIDELAAWLSRSAS